MRVVRWIENRIANGALMKLSEVEQMKQYQSPQGAVALLVIYVLLIAALWGSAYATLLSRGVTQ